MKIPFNFGVSNGSILVLLEFAVCANKVMSLVESRDAVYQMYAYNSQNCASAKFCTFSS
jgi:hypothetical protein